MAECTLAENAALDGKHSSSGGAIFVAQGEGTINIARSTLARNYVTGYKADGGALSLGSGFAVTVNDTEISANNVSGVTAFGGALRSSGSVSVWRSSIAENKVFSHGEADSSRFPHCVRWLRTRSGLSWPCWCRAQRRGVRRRVFYPGRPRSGIGLRLKKRYCSNAAFGDATQHNALQTQRNAV